jgi:hypothetical protein
MRNRSFLFSVLLAAGVLCFQAPGYANPGEDVSYAARGASKLLGSVFAIPKAMLQDSGRVMFPFGIVTGAVRGTFQTVAGVVGGVADVARGGAPYAKYAALAI